MLSGNHFSSKVCFKMYRHALPLFEKTSLEIFFNICHTGQLSSSDESFLGGEMLK